MSLIQESQFLIGSRFRSFSFSPYPLAFSLPFCSLQELGVIAPQSLSSDANDVSEFQFLTGIRGHATYWRVISGL